MTPVDLKPPGWLGRAWHAVMQHPWASAWIACMAVLDIVRAVRL